MLQRWGNKQDTSNNEMEYQAMFEALQFTHPKAFIMMETDSQGCLDGLTKYRLRWEKNGWNRSDGQPVENANLIRTICPLIDDRHVGFWKIKGHSKDPWNNLADALAVRGRNVQSKLVVVQIFFRAIIEGKETFQALPRISVSSHANIYDFWPTLIDKFGRGIGEPEDYEIWQGHSPIRGPLVQGHTYEIVSRITPGRPRPQAAARRNSIDLTTPPPPKLTPKGSPSPKRSFEAPPPQTIEPPPLGVPPQWTAVVTYQPQGLPEKVWRGWFTAEDTEYSLEHRARKELNMFGCWGVQPIGEMLKESA
jgi:ribonuclease HI